MNVPPGWRLFSALTKKEAQELLDTFVSGLPERANAFMEEVRRRGGPADHLDFTRESLVPFWTWVMATQRLPDPPATEDEMRAADPPWWFDFHPPLGMELGPDLARLVTLLAAYVATMVFNEWPGSAWVIGSKRSNVNFRQPLLEIDGGAHWPVDTSLVSITLNALGPERLSAHPEGLLGIYDAWTGGPSVRLVPTPVAEPPPYGVAPIDQPEFTHEIGLDDVVAHEEERRVARFVELLREQAGIVEAHHEDREIILVNAPGLADDALEAIVDRVWQQAEPGR